MRFPALYQVGHDVVKRIVCIRHMKFGGVLFLAVLLFVTLLAQESYSLTAEEIAYLKKAGVSQETIHRMIEQENARLRQSRTGIWDVENEEGRRSTLYHAGSGSEAQERERIEQEKVERAWEMLRNLVIDARE